MTPIWNRLAVLALLAMVYAISYDNARQEAAQTHPAAAAQQLLQQ